MKFILGKKKEMTQIFLDNGDVVPVTKVQAGPCVVTQIKTMNKDGYSALQIGFGEIKRLKKPLKGHLKNIKMNCRYINEFRDKKAVELNEIKVGDSFGTEIFSKGDMVDVCGVSKGKGFQGVVKRHKFAGSPASHGHKDQLRMPGSIGATHPNHVFKGMRMAGRMGSDNVTVKNLKIVDVDIENNILYIKGAVPGARNGLVKIKGAGEIKICQ